MQASLVHYRILAALGSLGVQLHVNSLAVLSLYCVHAPRLVHAYLPVMLGYCWICVALGVETQLMHIHSCVHGMKLSTVVYGWLHCCCLGVSIDIITNGELVEQ